MIEENKTQKKAYKLVWLYVFSLCLSNFFIDFTFAIKPYMFVSGIILFLFLLHKIDLKIKVRNYDLLYIVFVVICSFGTLFSENKDLSIRYVLGLFIIYFSYTIFKHLLVNFITKEDLIKIINKIGIIFSAFSLVYYFAGLFSLNFNYIGNNIISYGVLIDRNVPRLITLASSDPNISCIILSIFCFFNLYDFSVKKNKIGFVLSLLCIILTMSRGAYLSIIAGFVVNVFLKREQKKENNKNKIFQKAITFLIVMIIVYVLCNKGIIELIINRFDSSISSGGSGRIDLWTQSFRYFLDNPIIGIGINNLHIYLNNTHVHNTFLQVLGETGIIGFIFYISFLVCIFNMVIKIYKKDRNLYFLVGLTIALYFQMFFLSILIQEVFFAYISIIHKLSIRGDSK